MKYAIYAMIYLGSALMVYNIYGFIRFARKVASGKGHKGGNKYLYIPIVLLVLFLLGYLAVGIFGDPDIIVSGILFGGSIFVFVMYRMLDRVIQQILEHEQLKSKLMATEESNRVKTEFLSGVSHEMRTPLNVILGLDTMALKDTSLSSETRGRVEKIGSSAKHLLSLINNILDMNSIETGEFVLKHEEFELEESVGQIGDIAASLCEEKGLTFACSIADSAKGCVEGDELRINQVLVNLLDNAVKYTDAPGSVTLSVEGETDAQQGRLLRFVVKDTGVGIDPAFLPKIFDVFAREDGSTTASRGGSGIGLAITKNIVDKLGGRIEVQSKKNVGSTFTVLLPIKRVEKEIVDSEPSLDGRRILIAEDIPENAEIVADLLELEGADSEHAENGKVAIEMFTASAPGYYDAILMDLRMPVMDGLSATREIRKSTHPDAQSIPIIALTANAFDSDVKESLAAGMNIHLAKPTDSDKLYAALKKALRK